MNYLEIVLQGYFNENNREFLEKYFLREFKKAEKEQFFKADEFFNGCIKVIESWEKHLQNRVFERKNELYLMLNGAKNGTMKYGDLQGKTIEQKKMETIEYCEQELKDVRPDGIGSLTFTVHLHSLTNGRIAHNMVYNEVLYVKQSILKAFQKTQPKNDTLPPQPININDSRTKKLIFETFANIDKQGWKYTFISEQDYNLFTDLLTNFFEYKPYTLPKTAIQLKRTCKTKVAKALGEIHKELSNENKLSTDNEYFKLIRVLNHFEKEKESDLYKALTR
jgi:hypothetical protein